MASYILTNLVGKSIRSEELNSFMINFDLPTNPKIERDYKERAWEAKSRNEKDNIYLYFKGYDRYKNEYGEPDSQITNINDDLILDEITIDNNYGTF